MDDSENLANDVSQIILNDTLDISLIHDFYTNLRNAMKSSSTVEIDAGNVARIDTAALQLLCSWYKSARNKGINIRWKNTGGYFYQCAKLTGLHTVMGISDS